MSKHSLTAWMRIWQIVGDETREAPAIVPVKANTVWRWSREGKFPKPYTLSPGCTAWKGEDVQNWLDSRQQRQS